MCFSLCLQLVNNLLSKSEVSLLLACHCVSLIFLLFKYFHLACLDHIKENVLNFESSG